MLTQKRFELITLGEELLLGLTANTHLTFIGEHLGRHGVTLQRNVTIPDDAETIGRAFSESWERSDVVITTGGLGPTCDDRTRETIAGILGCRLVFHPETDEAIKERFARFGRPVTSNNLKQAYYPEGAEVISNPNGTAPGIWFGRGGKILVMLPGPPSELRPMFLGAVIPRLAAHGLISGGEAYVQVKTAGIGESALETKLQPVFEKHGQLNVAYCAHAGQVDLRLNSLNEDLTGEDLETIAGECRDLLGDDFLCMGELSMVKVISDFLRAHDLGLAVAESCTGGLMASCFTDLPGASKFFTGGIVCYGNASKVELLDVPECLLKQHGAVSAETAAAMATGVAERLDADYGLSLTGFAGPCGGNAENPVGTIFIGLHTPKGIWSKRINYPGSRTAVKQRAVNAALDWLRRVLIHHGGDGADRIVRDRVEPGGIIDLRAT
ncbi:MAG: competence/damage-inducible protein A [Verrucomicrobia bacterium]|nr:MAG: competence/damage-inducible protein A [Verrucomicrobiota bacterium]